MAYGVSRLFFFVLPQRFFLFLIFQVVSFLITPQLCLKWEKKKKTTAFMSPLHVFQT